MSIDSTVTEHNRAIRKISSTLQGPVIDTLAELVPDVGNLPRRDALYAILDDIDLLYRCFIAFRTQPDRFAHILVDKHNVSIDDAETLLACGRSLDSVVAMVVRTAAKRYFRRELDGATAKKKNRRMQRHYRQRNLMTRLRSLMMSTPDWNTLPPTRAEALYEVFKDHLRHDWQVPMIPEYCQMSPSTVRRLGPRILDYRMADDLRRLRLDPDNPPPPTALTDTDQMMRAGYITQYKTRGHTEFIEEEVKSAPKVADTRQTAGIAKLDYSEPVAIDRRANLSAILTPDGARIKAAAFSMTLLDPKIRALLPQSTQTVRITGMLNTVSGLVGTKLVNDLGLRLDQLAVFLLGTHAVLGDKRFETAFGVPGRPEYVDRVIERAKRANLTQDTSLEGVADFISKCFNTASA